MEPFIFRYIPARTDGGGTIKIALIYPPTTVLKGDPSVGSQIVPLGLAYIAAVVENAGHEVKIFDFSASDNIDHYGYCTYYGDDFGTIYKTLSEFSPDVVGIQCMYSGYADDAYDMARYAKIVNPSILTVMGGAHASTCPDEVSKIPEVDLVVVGEGEMTFLDIITRYGNHEDLRYIPGTAGNPPRPLVDDIDDLPSPALHLLPLGRYLEKNKYAPFNMRKSMFVVTSRGCPFHCKFCSIKSVWGRSWRYHSPKRVVDEIQVLVKKYGVGEIHFIDDNISVNAERLKEICTEILKRKLNIKWTTPNGVAIWTLTEEVLRKMKKSGCYRLTFGIETASLNTQKYIRKTQIDLSKARKIIRYANRLGIWTISTFIIGFPDETVEDINTTVEFAVNADLDFAFFFLPMLFPGTDMTKDYFERGLVKSVHPKELSGRCAVATPYFSTDELNNMQKDAYRRVIKKRLFHPFKFLEKIRSVEDLRYCIRLIMKGVKQLKEKYVIDHNPKT